MGKVTGTALNDKLRQEVADGLLYTHARLRDNTQKNLEAASFLYGLIELLSEKGLISIEELDERKAEVAQRLTKKTSQQGIGVFLQEPEYDKYTFEGEAKIDCENRIHLCKAACCRLPFALSKQDIREGIIHWDLGQPYIIAQEKDGYCTHLERGCCRCTVREHRPVPCRAYDCRKDKTIWLDFENKIINPEILKDDWPRCASEENRGGAGCDQRSG
jgi:Fe-S-cluster containining protein